MGRLFKGAGTIRATTTTTTTTIIRDVLSSNSLIVKTTTTTTHVFTHEFVHSLGVFSN